MIEAAKFHSRLRKLQSQKRALEAKYDRAIKDARNKKNRDLEEELIAEAIFERNLIDDDISKLSSRHVIQLAERYLVPIPEFSTEGEDWTESRVDGRYRLSDHAIVKLRSDIRRERKERHEHVFMWLAAATGIIGALTGLVAVLLSLLQP